MVFDLLTRVRRLGLIDWVLLKLYLVAIGILVAAFWTDLSGFVQQNWIIWVIIIIALGIKPAVVYLRPVE